MGEPTTPTVSTRAGAGLGRELRDLGPLTKRVLAYNVGYLALVWLTITGAVALFWAWPAWYTFVLAFVVISARQQALLNIEHECIHGTFVQGRRANELLAIIACASPVGSPYRTSRARHLSHHRLLGSPDDPDLPLHGADGKSTVGGFVRYFATGLVGGYALMVILGGDKHSTGDRRTALADLRNVGIAQLALWGVSTVVTTWWVYPLLWAAPLVTLTAFFHLVRSFGEHAVVPDERPAHDNLLISIPSNRVERYLVAPYYMNFHSEHHLFPWIPAPKLPEAQRRLDAQAAAPPRILRSSYVGAMRTWTKSLHR